MKIARLNFYFKLPEDFNGNINDALEEVIKYREKHGKGAMAESTPMAQEIENSKVLSKKGYDELMFEKFVRLVEEGYLIHGEVNICDYDRATRVTKPIK